MSDFQAVKASLDKAMRVIDVQDKVNTQLRQENNLLRKELEKLKSDAAGLQMQALHISRVMNRAAYPK